MTTANCNTWFYPTPHCLIKVQNMYLTKPKSSGTKKHIHFSHYNFIFRPFPRYCLKVLSIESVTHWNELQNMHFYGLSWKTPQPCYHTTFSRLHQHFSKTGNFKKHATDNGHLRTVRSPHVKEAVRPKIEEHPSTKSGFSSMAAR